VASNPGGQAAAICVAGTLTTARPRGSAAEINTLRHRPAQR
jgi:hypothetical protein